MVSTLHKLTPKHLMELILFVRNIRNKLKSTIVRPKEGAQRVEAVNELQPYIESSEAIRVHTF